MALDDAAYPTLYKIGDEIGFPPEAILLVAYLESRFTPSIHTPGTTYFGLTQISGDWLRRHGIDPADFLTWPASRQLEEATKRFFIEQMNVVGVPSRRTAGVLQALNLAPARVKDGDPSRVLYRKVVDCPAKGDPYCSNRGLDVNGDSAITIGDLDLFADRLRKEAPYQAALRKLEAASSIPAVPAPLAARSVTFADLVPTVLVLAGGLASAAYFYQREMNRKRRLRAA